MEIPKGLVVLLVVVVLFILAFVTISWFYANSPSSTPTPAASECIWGSDRLYYVCCVDNNNKQVPCNGYRCGQRIYVSVNVTNIIKASNASLPNPYYICVTNTKLVNEFIGDEWKQYYTFNNSTGMEFNCKAKTYTLSEKHGVDNWGAIPNINGRIDFMDVYLFPANRNYSSVNDFMNNINTASLIFSLSNNVTC